MVFPVYPLTLRETLIAALILSGYAIAWVTHPEIALLPTAAATYILFTQGILVPIRKLKRPYRTSALLLLAVTGLLVCVVPAHAIEFSFLLSSTEDTLKTCITDEIEGLSIIPNLIFGAFRVGVMGGVAWQGWEAIEDRKKKQDNSDHIKLLVGVAILIILVGVFEPLVVQACS